MKKKISVLLAASLLALGSLAGCGGRSQETAIEESTEAVSEAVTEEAETEAPKESPEAEASDASDKAPDYSLPENWAYLADGPEGDPSGGSADVFFICPTVYGGTEDSFNMSLDDEDSMASFLGATNMEKGIYDQDCRFFAPYYRQAGLNVYELPAEEQEPYLEFAYEDISLAFDYYLDNFDDERPIILAGFSQGADLCIRLLKDKFEDEALNDRLIACYAIGWRVTEEELAEYPWLHFAGGEYDTGVIIAFNSEAPEVTSSLMIPEGTRSLCINPLNWKTDGTPADKSLNTGACFTDYDGNITSEVPGLTGAYIDTERGSLKVPDVSPEDYPPVLSIFSEGIYHLYDYQFFYRNLQENVAARISAFKSPVSTGLEDAIDIEGTLPAEEAA